jgi:chromatin remodeling complex protein RSC6
MVKRKKAKRTTKKKGAKKRGGKKAFGGYTVNFKGCDDPLEKIFGTKPIPPSQMTKKLWNYVKRNRLNLK